MRKKGATADATLSNYKLRVESNAVGVEARKFVVPPFISNISAASHSRTHTLRNSNILVHTPDHPLTALTHPTHHLFNLSANPRHYPSNPPDSRCESTSPKDRAGHSHTGGALPLQPLPYYLPSSTANDPGILSVFPSV